MQLLLTISPDRVFRSFGYGSVAVDHEYDKSGGTAIAARPFGGLGIKPAREVQPSLVRILWQYTVAD